MAYLNLKKHIKNNNSTLVPPDPHQGLHQGSPKIYQIHTEDTSISGDIRKCQLGTAKHGPIKKVIMMVGATGSGKTTMINAMFNHVVDVKFEDQFRFRLVDESEQAKTLTQADSQTNTVTAYTLHHQDEFAVPYTLSLIDTPGFDDTEGKIQDKTLIEKIRLFFTTAGIAGINHIDAVGFVLKASDERLTENQQYIFDSVLSLWGKDIKENIFVLFSHADNRKPAALAALDKANISFEKGTYFKFNNSALFGNVETEDDDDDLGFPAVYWKMNTKNFDQFLIERLVKVKSKSLTLSQAVLDLRNMLEICQNGNKEDIQNIIVQQEQLNVQLAKLEKHKAITSQEANTSRVDIQKLIDELEELEKDSAVVENSMTKKYQNEVMDDILNMTVKQTEQLKAKLAVLEKQRMDLEQKKNFDYTDIIHELKKVPVAKRAINCSECERTCHYPCMAIWTPYLCSIFTWGGECKVCYCSYAEHDIQDFKYERERKTIQKTDTNLQIKHLQKQEDLKMKADEIKEKQKEVRKKVEKIQEKNRTKAEQQEELKKKVAEIEKQIEERMKAVKMAKQKEEERGKAAETDLQKLEKELEVNKTNLEAAQKKFVGLVMVKKIIIEILQEIALQPADKKAGWKEHEYIEQMIQTEETEGKDGWQERTQQLQELQQKSVKLSQVWDTVFSEINPDYSFDLKLSKEDNEKCKKSRKIIEFKKKVQLSN